jgi:hypothetical protein
MLYFIGLYYNLCVLGPLENELRTKKNTNTLKIILLPLVYSSYASFHDEKSLKYTKLFWMKSPTDL